MLLHLPELCLPYFFFLTLEDDDEEEEDDDDLLLLLRFLTPKTCTSLVEGPDSRFSLVNNQVPMALAAAQSALIVGLWPLRFFWLSCDLDADALFVDLFSVHIVDGLLDRILCLEDLTQ